MDAIASEAPPAAKIEQVEIKPAKPQGLLQFTIDRSDQVNTETTGISPDIAICKDCLNDLKHQPHRIDYPLINCTNCGPRFSIIKELPYDRDKTTMEKFEMCTVCREEYTDPANRRFHAQPVACNHCGPSFTLTIRQGKVAPKSLKEDLSSEVEGDHQIVNNLSAIIEKTRQLLMKGEVILTKGQGGYHLMADAFNHDAVNKIRTIKHRDHKPLAVMFRNIAAASEYAHLINKEKEILESWRRPIVLCKQKKQINSLINEGIETLGIMLPYMPFHHLLFKKLETPAIVLTSGNFSDEPIARTDEEAKRKFQELIPASIFYNREIYNRLDDSVGRIIYNEFRLIRRSRAYVPTMIKLPFKVDEIFAAGAEMKNTFCLGKGNKAIMSQHIGDLKNFETFQFYKSNIERFKELFRVEPKIVACDLHPDYHSTNHSEDWSEQQNLDIEKIQHHHAHLASVMAEHGMDEKIIGISLDGTGYGTDGHSWGGEFMIADLQDFERAYHFEYVPLPGGDKANKEPWRMALAYLYNAYGEKLVELPLPFIENTGNKKLTDITSILTLAKDLPLTSSCGRLFDAVAALLGICHENNYDGQAAMMLETIIENDPGDHYPFTNHEKSISFTKTIMKIIRDLLNGVSKATISAKFHNTVAWACFETAMKLKRQTGIEKLVLSGGCFQNKYLTEKCLQLCNEKDFEVYLNKAVPANDGGIALGQLAVAAKRRNSHVS